MTNNTITKTQIDPRLRQYTIDFFLSGVRIDGAPVVSVTEWWPLAAGEATLCVRSTNSEFRISFPPNWSPPHVQANGTSVQRIEETKE